MDKMIENNSEVLDDQSEPVQSSRYSRITSDEQEFIKDLTMRIQETLRKWNYATSTSILKVNRI